MNTSKTSHLEVSFTFQPKNGRKNGHPRRDEVPSAEPGSVPRIARLMALAIRFAGLIERGEVRDYADLARLGHVSRPRITQVMTLLDLAPDIQEAILFLPRTLEGRDPVGEHDLRPIAAESQWAKQREVWQTILRERMQ